MRNAQSLKRFVRAFLVAAMALPLMVSPLFVDAAIQGPTVPVNVDGSINSDTETIAFGGQMTISTRIIEDPVFSGPTLLEINIDFSNVKGAGKASGKKFATEAQVIVHRPLLPFDEIEVIFPYTAGNEVHAARMAKAIISVNYNARSGFVLTSKIKRVPVE